MKNEETPEIIGAMFHQDLFTGGGRNQEKLTRRQKPTQKQQYAITTARYKMDYQLDQEGVLKLAHHVPLASCMGETKTKYQVLRNFMKPFPLKIYILMQCYIRK